MKQFFRRLYWTYRFKKLTGSKLSKIWKDMGIFLKSVTTIIQENEYMTLAQHKKQIVRDLNKYCGKHTLVKCESKPTCSSCEITWYRNELAKERMKNNTGE